MSRSVLSRKGEAKPGEKAKGTTTGNPKKAKTRGQTKQIVTRPILRLQVSGELHCTQLLEASVKKEETEAVMHQVT